ncbi:hypothetical protein WBJ53_19670 [Spirosoma sp. SC4-14]|uniref:hypothetical protein n=1 Tax=Spirosoma sp. SC4-14 TaxID=3128900 RepID=UPI0030CFB792
MNSLKDRKEKLHELIAEAHNADYAQQCEEFVLNDSRPVAEAAQAVLQNTPRAFGICVVMSAHLCAILTDSYKLPAVVVAGDLVISGIPAFQTDVKIQQPELTEIIIDDWQGHSWVEIGGLIVDISLGRTADLAPDGSNLKAFVHKQFGNGKGLLAFPVEHAYSLDMIYAPREVLADNIITAIIQSHHS